MGLYITLILFPIAIILVVIAVAQNFMTSNKGTPSSLVLEPIVPGLNLPVSELGYYSIALVVCSVFHEFGHALASVKEDVHLVNVGLNVLFILPIAYVNISLENLNALNSWKALRIVCAGVWHNLVLTFFAYIIYWSLPYIFSLTFYINHGVSISDISKSLPLAGAKGLHIGDTVISINDCTVRNDLAWESCLQTMRTNKPSFCVEADLVHNLDESVPLRHFGSGAYDCCSAEKSDRLCFEYLDSNDGILEIPPHACLPVRTIIEKSPQFCTTNIKNCLNSLHCIRPVMNNNTNLFKIKRLHKADVIYIGLATDLLYTVQISPYVPKHVLSSTLLPDIVTKFFKYIIIFSTGLAIVNVIPCIFMDGQHITNALINILFGASLGSAQNVNIVSLMICLCCTALLLFHCICVIYNMLSASL